MEQMDIFDFIDKKEEYKIRKPIRLIELFGGIGAQAMALRDIGANFEHYRLVEFDKYKIAAYNAIHGTDFEPQDITQISGEDLGIVEKEKYTYLLTYSFPCQALSLAGQQKGMEKGTNTRSSLLWEVERLLNECTELPQVLLMENVPQVHSYKNMPHFEKWIKFLEDKGYSNYWQDLNAKDYGVAQSRNRCFMVSILGNYDYKFPKPIPLDKTMRDYLETEVDEKYYLTNDKAQMLIDKLIKGGKILNERTNERTNEPPLTLHSATDRQLKSQMPSQLDMMQVSANTRTNVAESVKQLGCLDSGTGKHQSNQVISYDGLKTCEYAGQHKNPQRFVEIQKVDNVIENIKTYGNKKSNYTPYDKAISYPLHSQDFVRTGFMDIAPTLAARDYKDPKVTVEITEVDNEQ